MTREELTRIARSQGAPDPEACAARWLAGRRFARETDGFAAAGFRSAAEVVEAMRSRSRSW